MLLVYVFISMSETKCIREIQNSHQLKCSCPLRVYVAYVFCKGYALVIVANTSRKDNFVKELTKNY